MTKREINGTTLEIVEGGQGQTVVFVHGSVSDYRTWQTQQETFAPHFHTVLYSRRYHWPNEKIADDVDYSMQEHVDDLQALLKTFDNTPIHLVGHSYGAFLCLLLAIRDPHLIQTLVLAEPPAITMFVSDPPKPHQLLKLLFTRPRTAIALIKFAATGLVPATKAIEKDEFEKGNEIFGRAVLGNDAYDKLSPERREQIQANFIKAEFTGSGFAPLNQADIRHVKIPTLLVNGANSPSLFHRVVDRLDELLPYSETVTIPAASHIMHEDNSSAFNTAVLDFLKRHLPTA